ncbi:MAG: Abi family protein, partial [Thermodesulfobacteriota bacterium]|nr:Abi family protein [Thermodesulfobacteriota bacterium]
MTIFNKPPLSIADQIIQWESRGLAIPDRTRAERYLSVISYYRLSAYTLPFQKGKPDHSFKPGINFEDILDLYIFDRRLRLLVLDAIERIEVALRARMTNVLAGNHGSHAYLRKDIFDTRYNHAWLIMQIGKKCHNKQAETFIKHYCSKYSGPELPPIWMVMEILTFKEVSVLFSSLRRKEDKRAIAALWNLPDRILQSWFRALSDLRNICAHQSRTWNREFGSLPVIPRKAPQCWPDLNRSLSDPRVKQHRRLYFFLVIIEWLLRKVNPGSSWRKRLYALLQEHPKVSRTHMGMPLDWADDPF